VEVEVGYHLTSVRTAVDYETISILNDALFFRQKVRHCYQVSHKGFITLRQVGNGGDVFAGYDKDVYGGLGVDVREGYGLIVLINDVALYLAFGDFAEDAVHFTPVL
jgi:hypothetical protein